MHILFKDNKVKVKVKYRFIKCLLHVISFCDTDHRLRSSSYQVPEDEGVGQVILASDARGRHRNH